jgi:hypothetical protein
MGFFSNLFGGDGQLKGAIRRMERGYAGVRSYSDQQFGDLVNTFLEERTNNISLYSNAYNQAVTTFADTMKASREAYAAYAGKRCIRRGTRAPRPSRQRHASGRLSTHSAPRRTVSSSPEFRIKTKCIRYWLIYLKIVSFKSTSCLNPSYLLQAVTDNWVKSCSSLLHHIRLIVLYLLPEKI